MSKKIKSPPRPARPTAKRAKAQRRREKERVHTKKVAKAKVAAAVRRQVEAQIDLSRSMLQAMLGTVESFESADAALKSLAPKLADKKKVLAEAAEQRIAAVKAKDAGEDIGKESPEVVLFKVEREAIKAERDLASLEAQATGHKETRKQTMAELRDMVRQAGQGQMLFTAKNDPPDKATMQVEVGGKDKAAPVPDGAWRGKDIKALADHGITSAVLEKLYSAGIATLGDLADKTANQFDKIKGIGASAREKLSDASVAYFKAHPVPTDQSSGTSGGSSAGSPNGTAKPAGSSPAAPSTPASSSSGTENGLSRSDGSSGGKRVRPPGIEHRGGVLYDSNVIGNVLSQDLAPAQIKALATAKLTTIGELRDHADKMQFGRRGTVPNDWLTRLKGVTPATQSVLTETLKLQYVSGAAGLSGGLDTKGKPEFALVGVVGTVDEDDEG